MISQRNRSISFADRVSLSPLRDRAEARRDLRARVAKTAAIMAAEERIGVALAELVEAGVDIERLDLPAMAEAGQRVRRARAL